MKNILITGSKGHIGSNLVQALKAEGDCHIFEATRENGCDLEEKGWVNNIPDGHYDVVIDLAQSRRYRDFPEGNEDVFAVNIRSTFELLEWSRIRGVKRFVFASTGIVYENQHGRKLNETDPCLPRSLYAASKLCAEHLIRQYADFFQVVIMRIFGVYGPSQSGNIIPSMIQRVRNGEEIYLAGNKGFFTTPIFISDCIKAISKVALDQLDTRELIFNLTGNEVLSLAEIVNIISKALNTKANIVVTEEEPQWVCGDNTLMRTFYRPEIPFALGLEKTLNG
ncbi:MAG: NAD(P)-dependent oxidoreductase [Deltaproteobacteria bacterium]|nr:NAD(P)-dependent oxidoreductase [Deltaproteobacteria bacterium]